MKTTLVVYGVARPQGSKSGYYRNGRVLIVESTKGVKEWRAHVTEQISEHIKVNDWVCPDRTVPVTVEYAFTLPRPKTNRLAAHTTKPDLDKLIRAVNDSATLAKLWADDSQITDIKAVKLYGEVPQLEMTVSWN